MKLEAVTGFLTRRIGLNPDSLGSTMLPKAIRERMRSLGMADGVEYALRLEGDDAEFRNLVDATVVEESWFFRGGEIFSHLAKRIAADGRSAPFRILCLPCCTGEEPYTMAIALLEHGVPPERWRIDGVDLSGKLVAKAVAGLYSEFSFRQTPTDMRAKYFRKEGAAWRIDETVRKAVAFQTGNAVDPSLLMDASPYDVIFCRNVLIYLTPEARGKVLANIERLLAKDGVVCMGHAEPLDDPRFEQREPREFFLFGFRRAVIANVPKAVVKRPVVVKVDKKEVVAAPAAPMRARNELKTVERLSQARQHADKGDYRAAMELCSQLEATEPKAEVYHLMGVIRLAEGDGKSAADLFRKALYLQPDHRDALTQMMHLHRAKGEAKQALLYESRLKKLGEGGTP